MSPDRDGGSAARHALGAHIRDPDANPPPAGIEERRLRIYRELFFNNIEGMLAGNFPVIRQILDGDRWTALVRDFYREHPSQTPLFTELAREFLRYLEARTALDRGDPPWLVELAHYEWVELALQISEARPGDIAHDPGGDLLAGAPVLSPLAWPLAYAWPVQRLGPDFLPAAPPPTPTLLLVQRAADAGVRFHELSPMTFRLLERIEEAPTLSGRAQLESLAHEAGGEADDAFLDAGRTMLEQLRDDGIILGARSG